MSSKKQEKKSNFLYYLIMFIIILGFILVIWSRYISTKGLRVREYSISSDKLLLNDAGVKIVQFSDLNYNSTVFEEELVNLVDTINELRPDLVFFTGDLFSKKVNVSEKDKEIITREFKRIESNIDKYAVKGDNDYATMYFDSVMNEAEFKVLNNTDEYIYSGSSKPIYLYGLDDMIKGNPNYDGINIDNDFYKIVLVHEPDSFDNFKDKNVDLVLAGHSRNGQVRLPFIGPLYRERGYKKYYDEHYIFDNTNVYISGGIGTNNYKFRFLTKPSINFFRLYNK